MELSLKWLRMWISHWRPAAGEAFGLRHHLASMLIAPVVVIAYVALLIFVRIRGPYRLERALPGGTLFNCQMPDLVQFSIYMYGVWEPDISAFVRGRLKEGDTFCDVGSHAGYYSLLAAKQVGASGSVIAIEASPANFTQLQNNLARNAATNVRAVNIAATAEEGVLAVHNGPAWNLGWSTTHPSRGLPVECQVSALPIPRILNAEEVRKLRLVKVDVEGTERELFAGLVEVLRNGRPEAEIVLEISPRWWKGPATTVEEALKPFIDEGYHIYLVDNEYGLGRYFRSANVRPPRRARQPIQSRFGQCDIVLSKVDQEALK